MLLHWLVFVIILSLSILVRREDALAHASDPAPCLEALFVSRRGLDLDQSLAGAHLHQHIEQLRVGRVNGPCNLRV